MKKLHIATLGLLTLLVVGCGGVSSTLSSSSSVNSTGSSITSSTPSSSATSVNEDDLTNDDFEKAKTTYTDDNGVEQDLTINTLYTKNSNPHLDPLKELHVMVVPFGFTDSNLQSVQTEANIDRIETTFFGGTGDVEKPSNNPSYWVSVAEYYQTSSYGKSNFTGKVLPTWVVYDEGEGDAKGTSDTFMTKSGGNLGIYAAEYIKKWYVAEYAKPDHGSLGIDAEPISYFDSNGDGYLDLVWVVYSHPTDQKNTNYWWAYVTYTANSAGSQANPNVKTLGWASIDWMSGFGGNDPHTFIHETGHTYGLPDYYNYENALEGWSPMGGIDMMDHNLGDHAAFSKFSLGWLNPWIVDLDSTSERAVITLHPTTTTGDCFILPSPNYNGTAFDEYIMVELMAPYGILAERDYKSGYQNVNGYSEPGVRITHVDARVFGNSHDVPLTDNPQDGEDYRVANTKGGRRGLRKDTDYFVREDGTKMYYTLTSLFESNIIHDNNWTTSKNYVASNRALFKQGDIFTLSDEYTMFKWADYFMPSGCSLWNKAKTITGWKNDEQLYEIDESYTCDYVVSVLSIEPNDEYGYEAKIEITLAK